MRDARRERRLILFVYFLAAMAWIADGITLAACKTLGILAIKKIGRQAPINIGTRALTVESVRCVQLSNAAPAIAA